MARPVATSMQSRVTPDTRAAIVECDRREIKQTKAEPHDFNTSSSGSNMIVSEQGLSELLIVVADKDS